MLALSESKSVEELIRKSLQEAEHYCENVLLYHGNRREANNIPTRRLRKSGAIQQVRTQCQSTQMRLDTNTVLTQIRLNTNTVLTQMLLDTNTVLTQMRLGVARVTVHLGINDKV
jgi:hypothetical protein